MPDLAQALGYEVANSLGFIDQNSEVSLEGTGFPIGGASAPVVPVMMFFPIGTQVRDFAMRGQKDYFDTTDVTPNPYESWSVKPNYDRRYTVLPTPAIGLTGVKEIDDIT